MSNFIFSNSHILFCWQMIMHMFLWVHHLSDKTMVLGYKNWYTCREQVALVIEMLFTVTHCYFLLCLSKLQELYNQRFILWW